MRVVVVASAAIAAVCACSAVNSGVAPPTLDGDVVSRAGDFRLTDTSRLSHELYYYRYAPAIVLMSQTDGSRLSRAAARELGRLQVAYASRGVVFFMINSNPKDSPEAARFEAESNKFAVPLLVDDLQLVREALNIQREGEVFVLDPKDGFKVAYHGPLDGRFTKSDPDSNSIVTNAYAALAIDAVLLGKSIADPRVAITVGKRLAPLDRGWEKAGISYSETVAPILREKCVSCHQKGGIGPFQMNSYETVKAFAPMMRETILTRRMPPFFADPHIGKWSNDTSLTPAEAKTLVHWIASGAPRGTGEDILKTHPAEAPEWPSKLGKPDVIVQLPSFDVPASGLVEYQRMIVPNPFNDDVWLRAVAFQPGARAALHHITTKYFADPNFPAKIPGSTVGSYVPGAGVQVYNLGTGAPVPAGGSLRYTMHYTTTGKAMTDSTKVGYYLLKTPPEIIRRAVEITNPGVYIPAGTARHVEYAYVEFPADALVYSVHPHAHYRGYAAELTQITPSGKESPILSVPHYDFNWQLDYDLAKPLLVKKGTRIRAKWIYDNSAHNRGNPDPKRNVTWGEQTPDEMMYFRVNYRWMAETSRHVRNDLQDQVNQSRIIGAVDVNMDGKLQISELRGSYASLAPRFAKLDLNHDGGLDLSELKAANVTEDVARRFKAADADF